MVDCQTLHRDYRVPAGNPFRTWCLLAVAVGCLVAATRAGAQPSAGDARPTPLPWNVVILNDADPTLPAYVALERAIRAGLGEPGRHPVNVFTETLDLLRFRRSQLEAEKVALLANKYAGMQLHAVIALGASSLEFAETHRARLWPGARIVFQGVPTEWLRGRVLSPMTVGFPLQHDLAGMADLALRLQPGLRRLVVLAGSGEHDRIMEDVARAQLANYGPKLAIEYWVDRPIDDFISGVAGLGATDAVLYLTIARDSEGRTFVPREVLHTLSEVSPAPIYGPFETYLGFGVTAGTMYSFAERGRRAAELVHGLLSDPAAPAPLLAPSKATCTADARQLERFGMADRLPADCEVRFAPPALWRDYRWHVLGTLAVVLGQAALIFALVLQRRRRRHAEDEALRRRTELAQASRLALAGELTASIAHEINQPLGAILANAGAAESLLKRASPPTDEMREIIGDVKQASLRAGEIIRRVRALVVARQAEREVIDLNEVVSDVITFIRGEAARRGVAVQVDLAQDLPELHGDRIQLQQAIVNLCINAMDAMRETHERRLLAVRTAAAASGVEIAVSDTGAGIPAESLPRLFDSFFTTKADGTGLGLSIARSIVETHEGTLTARNRCEGGALFTIVLPARARVQAAAEEVRTSEEGRPEKPMSAPAPQDAIPRAS